MLEQALRNHKRAVDSFLDGSQSIGIVLLDEELNIVDSNSGFLRQFSLQHIPQSENLGDYFELEFSDVKQGGQFKLVSSRKSGTRAVHGCHFMKVEEGFLFFSEKQALSESYALEKIGSMNTELVNMQREMTKKNFQLEQLRSELAERVVELEDVLSRIKKLEGIIPICMHCKKIRDKQDAWNRLEEYITEHSEAQFSHGICPDCLDHFYKV